MRIWIVANQTGTYEVGYHKPSWLQVPGSHGEYIFYDGPEKTATEDLLRCLGFSMLPCKGDDFFEYEVSMERIR